MQSLSSTELLRVWELGDRRPVWYRAMLLLGVLCPDRTQKELAKISLGQRNARVFQLCETMFGRNVTAFVHCPRCDEALQFQVDCHHISLTQPPAPEGQLFSTVVAGLEIQFRPLNSHDLSLIEEKHDLTTKRRFLAGRCLIRTSQAGIKIDTTQLPESVIDAIGEQLAEHDPLSDVRFQVDCASCEHQWSAPFNIVTFVWTQLAAKAQRLLDDVHALARAYGWRENDILNMSAVRRNSYLERAL